MSRYINRDVCLILETDVCIIFAATNPNTGLQLAEQACEADIDVEQATGYLTDALLYFIAALDSPSAARDDKLVLRAVGQLKLTKLRALVSRRMQHPDDRDTSFLLIGAEQFASSGDAMKAILREVNDTVQSLSGSTLEEIAVKATLVCLEYRMMGDAADFVHSHCSVSCLQKLHQYLRLFAEPELTV